MTRFPFVWRSGEASLEIVDTSFGEPSEWTIRREHEPAQRSFEALRFDSPVTEERTFDRYLIEHYSRPRSIYVERGSGFSPSRLLAILERASVEVMTPPEAYPPEPPIALLVTIPHEVAEDFRKRFGSGARKVMANTAEAGARNALGGLYAKVLEDLGQ